MKQPFAIKGYVFNDMPALVATVSDGVVAGRGEAAGVYYFDDDVPKMMKALERIRPQVEAGLTRAELQQLLPPGGARNALDCALWELEAAQAGCEVWELAGLGAPKPRITTMTAGADAPEKMAKVAAGFAGARALKLKLTGEPELDVARVEAVRAACPGVWLGVDANQGYTLDSLKAVIPAFQRLQVKLIEQPLARGEEAQLDGFASPIPLAADESVQSSADLPAMVGRFDVINIKLDKCGGLTEGLLMVERARDLGFDLMVGNMAGSSWAMAASFIIGQACDVVDLDGPLALSVDRSPAVTYADGMIWSDATVWGAGVRLGG
jgi:L-alanine-DL-glutamate epimerase-like enolase superfamily enzyme